MLGELSSAWVDSLEQVPAQARRLELFDWAPGVASESLLPPMRLCAGTLPASQDQPGRRRWTAKAHDCANRADCYLR